MWHCRIGAGRRGQAAECLQRKETQSGEKGVDQITTRFMTVLSTCMLYHIQAKFVNVISCINIQ